jgi:hypothetical protein
MVNAREHDLLPGVLFDWRTDLDNAERIHRAPEVLGPALISLVDQGLLEIRRITPDGDAEGTVEVIGRAELPTVLADRAVWEYSDRGWLHRDDGLVIVETAAGQKLSRTDQAGVPNPQGSNPYVRHDR